MIELVRVFEDMPGGRYYSEECPWQAEYGSSGSPPNCATMYEMENKGENICRFNCGSCFIEGELNVVCSKAIEIE